MSIMPAIPVLDLHQDLLPHVDARPLYGAKWQTSWQQVDTSPVRLVLASTWTGYRESDILSAAAAEVNIDYMTQYTAWTRDAPGWHLVLTPEDVDRAFAPHAESRGVLIHAEGVGDRGSSSVEHLFERWLALGCRSVGLVWNEANGLAFGPDEPSRELTTEGQEAIHWLDRAPMVIDLAHMSEACFWHTMELSTGPVVVSHANARALCDHPRNLRDDQLRAIAERGGVVGLVFATQFINEKGRAGVSELVKHAHHMLEVMGGEYVAIGSDLGGVLLDEMLDLNKVEKIPLLLSALGNGLPDEVVCDIAWRNAARVIKDSLGKGTS